MPIFNSLFSWLMKKRIHQIELFIKYPHDVQLELFKKLVTSASETEWGKKYEYSSITTPQQFRERVPLSDYNSLKPYIERLRKGEQNLLWNTDIKWFAKSSGTTSDKSKYIPVSNEALEECHYKGGKDMLSIYFHNHPDSLIFDGRGLAMGGSSSITEVNNESYYTGDLSAILMQNLPLWVQLKKTPSRSIALMDEWESKIEKMAHVTMEHDVTSISGVPSWTLVLIRRILELAGKTNLAEVWPNLEVFFHGGVNFDPYRKQFKELIQSDIMTYVETYNASEGFFGIQDRTNESDMLLMLDYGIYYEFVPFEQVDNENARTLLLDEVETGKNYAMIISTNGGLWRYMIGDTIKFTSLLPFRIKITGRTKNFINAFGEEVIIENAEKALAIACEKCNAVISDYTAAPIYFNNNKSAAHEWLIEFARKPLNLDVFTDAFDNALKSLNSDYEAKRYKNMVLGPPVIKSLPDQTFYNWLKKRDKLGGQNKVPRLSNNRKYVDEILTMLNT
ncbi:MAG: GH3 auxin-responsive promoter family protein [Bacteroidales bacterium]|nr:GH3 auxin-responsive promoter family protein [Bacteroidales bacterium]